MSRLLLVAAAVAAAAAPARAEVFGASFRSTVWGVEMTVPRDWELSEQAAYPGIVARAYEHKGGARMTLAAQRLLPGEDDRAYVDRNQKTLVKLGYHVVSVTPHPTGALILEAATPDKKRAVRQAYVARGDTAYVLTIATRAEQAGAYVRPFDETLRSLVFSVPAPAPPPTPSQPEPSSP